MKRLFFMLSLLLMTCMVQAQTNRRTTRTRKPQTTVRKPASRPASKPAAAGKKSATNFCPDNRHPHLIDLGLPSETKWSCCNVDAKIPEEYGGYYAFGEVKEKKSYGLDTYRYYEDGDYFIWTDLIHFTGTEYDVAHVKMGDPWVMPTCDQFDELFDQCTFEWEHLMVLKEGYLLVRTAIPFSYPVEGLKVATRQFF